MLSLSQGPGQETGNETLIAFAYLSKRAVTRQAPAPAWMAASKGGASATNSDVTVLSAMKVYVRPAGDGAKEAGDVQIVYLC